MEEGPGVTIRRLDKTDELVEALQDLEKLRTDFFVEGIDLERFDEIVEAVRRVDAETVRALHMCRIKELSPYYPEHFLGEETGYEAAEERLRADIPKEEDL